MAYVPPNVNGQATKANSSPVVIASDQDALPITDNGGSLTIDAASLPLPTGAATSAKQPALGTAGTASTDVITVQGIASGTAQPISGTVTANAGTNMSTASLALETGGNLAASKVDLDIIAGAISSSKLSVKLADGDDTTLGTKTDAKNTATDTTSVSVISVLKQISASSQTPPSRAVTNAGTFVVQATLAAETTKVIGTVNQGTSPWVNNTSQINGVTPLMGNGTTGTGSQRVTIASDNTAFSVKVQDGSGTALTSTAGSLNVVQQAATATLANVSGSASSVTLLSSNSARKGGSIYNDSTALLYVKFGSTASTTSFNVLLAASAYFEINAGYTGRIDGIWASATGTARVNEIT